MGKISTNTTNTQQNGFVSGSGISFKKYIGVEQVFYSTISSIINALNSGNLTLNDSGIVGNLEMSGNTTNTTSAYYFKGYLKAPSTG
jgi:hypothetical protein